VEPEVEKELTDQELLLAAVVVYGFSLSDKMWCKSSQNLLDFCMLKCNQVEFNVERVKDVDWNDEAFTNLVIPSGRKALLQSLVEAHHKELGFDDFIKGKGQGLVINLFGPPGVGELAPSLRRSRLYSDYPSSGKTFSAEATSEHMKRPLYVVGAGDLGTKAADLDLALERVFDVATMWKAIVLIDEVSMTSCRLYQLVR
jgi:hypothetical protein